MSIADHAPAPPSGLERIVPCPGSLKLSGMVPEPGDTEESIEGTRAHQVAMHYAEEHAWLDDGGVITAEMKSGAALWAERVNSQRPDLRHFETAVSCARIHDAVWGTPDYFEWSAQARIIRVRDYKFGHVYVEVLENLQLLAYASGVCTLLCEKPENITFEFEVVQPRWYGKEGKVRTWKLPGAKLHNYETLIRDAVNVAFMDDPPTLTGNHCEFCIARHACVTLQRATASIIDFAGVADAMLSEPTQVGNELHLLNQMIARLKARAVGLNEQAIEMLKRGVQVPHFKLESQQGRNLWLPGSEKELEILAMISGLPLEKPKQFITPAQAIELGIDAAVVAKYANRTTSMTIAPDDGKTARRIFGDK